MTKLDSENFNDD